MKSILILVMITSSTYAAKINSDRANAESLAQDILIALKKHSSSDFIQLFPSMKSFKELMKENAGIYGGHLEEAEKEFSNEYDNRILPLVEKRFQELSSSHIDWTLATVQHVSVESNSKQSNVATIEISFSVGEKEYKLTLDRAMFLNNKWHISQFISLV